MQMRTGVIVAVVLVALLGLVAWMNNRERPQSAAPPAPDATGEPSGPAESQISPPTATDPGITWTVPKGWLTELGAPMRVATYIVPGAGQGNDAECAVYYFGPGAGGGVEMNVQRWQDEFESVEKHDLKQRTVSGVDVARLSVTGTFSGHTMRTDAAASPHPHWGLLGAIAQGPQGDVFFKLTGPAATVDAAGGKFDAMLASIRVKPKG
jgi:hypothetical protein